MRVPLALLLEVNTVREVPHHLLLSPFLFYLLKLQIRLAMEGGNRSSEPSVFLTRNMVKMPLIPHNYNKRGEETDGEVTVMKVRYLKERTSNFSFLIF